jgi:hypothetical protein
MVNQFDDCDRCGSDRHNTNVQYNYCSVRILFSRLIPLCTRNALQSGGYMNTLPTVSAKPSSNAENRSNRLLSAMVGRVILRVMSGAIIAERAGI